MVSPPLGGATRCRHEPGNSGHFLAAYSGHLFDAPHLSWTRAHMQTNDVVNGLFEAAGGVLLWFSVRKLWIDREVKGVYWPAWLFYSAWGMWNLVYYPSLDQWCGFAGGLIVTSANLTWVASYLYLRSHKTPSSAQGAK